VLLPLPIARTRMPAVHAASAGVDAAMLQVQSKFNRSLLYNATGFKLWHGPCFRSRVEDQAMLQH